MSIALSIAATLAASFLVHIDYGRCLISGPPSAINMYQKFARAIAKLGDTLIADYMRQLQ